MEQIGDDRFKLNMGPDWAEVTSISASLKRFGGKRSLEFEPKIVLPNATTVVEQDALNFGNDEVRFKSYAKPALDTGSLGALEYELIFYTRPPFNRVDFNVSYAGLVPYRQYPLTNFYQPGWHNEWSQDIKQVTATHVILADGTVGAHTPEDVLGSLAFYHDAKHGIYADAAEAELYKRGKAFHLFRPRLRDALGRVSWATLELNGGILAIIFDSAWLDTAVYPVVVDPLFGYQSAGANTTSNSNKGYGMWGTGGVGTLDWVRTYMRDNGAGALGGGAVYQRGNASAHENKTRVDRAAGEIGISDAAAWNESTMTGAAIAVADYIMLVASRAAATDWYRDNGLATSRFYYCDWVGTFNDPHFFWYGTWAIYSSYASYTAGGAAAELGAFSQQFNPFTHDGMSAGEVRAG